MNHRCMKIWNPISRHPLVPPIVTLVFAAVLFLGVALPALAEEIAPQSAPDVYFIRLQPQSDISATPRGSFRTAYERLEPTLFELMADDQIVSFEFLPESGTVRVIGVTESVQLLVVRPEVDEVRPLHHRQVMQQAAVSAVEQAAPDRFARTDNQISEPAAPSETYTVSGVVRDYDGTLVKDARVATAYNDPMYASDWTDANGYYSLSLNAGTYHIEAEKTGWPGAPAQTITVPPAQVVDFTLPQRHTISGKVLDWDGTPIKDANISTDFDDPIYAYDYTDATGAFELLVTAGTYHVSIYKSGMPSLPDQVVTTPPNQTVNFTYPRRYTIRGTVRNYDGALVQDVYVSTSWSDPMHTSAETDASGAYTLTVTAGTFNIGASKTGYPDPEDRQVTVPPDATGVDFTFPQPYPISGTVRDENGQPVAGATVYGGVNSVTTAADGTYTTLAAAGDHSVSASKDGYQSASSVLVPVPPAVTSVDFVLLIKNQTITGRVTDSQGLPLADAYVSASSITCRSSGSGSTRTKADGTYTLAVPVGTYHVKASKDGFIPTPSELVKLPSAAQVNFTLEPLAYTIRGAVKDSQGQPVKNAWVYASACGLSYGANTDATGAYTLAVSANTYSVYASKSDYPDPPAQIVSTPPNADHVDFVLPPAYTIGGRVTDPQGRPLADVRVGTDYSNADYDSDYTDTDGRYTLHLAAGSYRIGAEKEGYDWPHRTAAVPPNQSGIDFVLTPVSLRIQGVVRDDAGRGMAGGYVCPTLAGESTSFSCKTTYYNGAYSKLLPAGTYRVSASASCYISTSVSDVTLPPDRTGLDFTIRLRDQLIAGRVTDSDGQPVCGASVRAQDGASDSDGTERNGRYSLNVPAGTYKVKASKTGYGTPPEQTITVPPSTTAINFVLVAPSNTIQGVVRDNHGVALAGVSISASSSSGTVTTATGADGSYTLKMMNGNWSVVASKPGYLVFPPVRTFTVPPNHTGADFTLIARSELTNSTYLPLILRGK